MATVVGTDETAKLRKTCKGCASIVEFTESEIFTLWSGKDYSGGSDGAKGIKCPKCGGNIITERW